MLLRATREAGDDEPHSFLGSQITNTTSQTHNFRIQRPEGGVTLFAVSKCLWLVGVGVPCAMRLDVVQ